MSIISSAVTKFTKTAKYKRPIALESTTIISPGDIPLSVHFKHRVKQKESRGIWNGNARWQARKFHRQFSILPGKFRYVVPRYLIVSDLNGNPIYTISFANFKIKTGREVLLHKGGMPMIFPIS